MVALRTRAMLLLAACMILLFLGIWAFQTEQTRTVAALGSQVKVVVAARPLHPWVPLTPGDLSTKQVPSPYTGPEHLTDPDQLVGRMLVAPIPAGAAIPSFALHAGPDLQPGEVAWELQSTGNVILDPHLQPGDRVSVLAATVNHEAEEVRQLLSGVRVVGVRSCEGGLAVTLAVTVDQGRALMAAENFARQVRVVRTPAGQLAGTEVMP